MQRRTWADAIWYRPISYNLIATTPTHFTATTCDYSEIFEFYTVKNRRFWPILTLKLTIFGQTLALFSPKLDVRVKNRPKISENIMETAQYGV